MQALKNEYFAHFAIELSDLRDFNHMASGSSCSVPWRLSS